VGGVTRVSHERDACVAADRRRHVASESGELVVELARDQQHGHLQLREAVPERLLGAGAREAEAGGQARGGVRAAVVEPARIGWERGEQRLGKPFAQERVHAISLDAGRARLVVAPSVVAFDVVTDAGGGAHQHEGLDEVGMGERHVQAQAPAHRVTDVRGPASLLRHQPGALPQVEGHVRKLAVARRVERDDVVFACERVGDDVPRAVGLGEPVDEHDAGHRP
jgi:hypothetical protein